jgi:squalene-hopene/tetraprenyl-beta-curcumene cyclase
MAAPLKTACVLALLPAFAPAAGAPAWNPAAAAHYLDAREVWWQSWDRAKRDHDTACVSCHTVLPYALGRPALRGDLSEREASPPERTMLAFIEKRVGLWEETEPFYKEASGPTKPAESRATEAIMNALILASYDARQGQLRDVTRQAFDHVWDLQLTTGAWDWLNFHNGPWESDESQYWGTTLAALAVGSAPEGYKDSPLIQRQLADMRGWLKREYPHQPLLNRMWVLWASAKMPGLLSPEERKALVAEIAAAQQKDGGWTLSNLGNWKRPDPRSDGYATALAVLALPAASPAAERGRQWLRHNQNADGAVPAWSLNKERDPASDAGRFMSDAATAYAALALEHK